jgi:hypothetical protein
VQIVLTPVDKRSGFKVRTNSTCERRERRVACASKAIQGATFKNNAVAVTVLAFEMPSWSPCHRTALMANTTVTTLLFDSPGTAPALCAVKEKGGHGAFQRGGQHTTPSLTRAPSCLGISPAMAHAAVAHAYGAGTASGGVYANRERWLQAGFAFEVATSALTPHVEAAFR